MKVLLLGASGLVGQNVLEQTLATSAITHIVAPTRRPLAVHAKLTNPISAELESLVSDVASWSVDAVICALGTTIAKAGSEDAFRRVDHALPLAFARAAHDAGAATYVLVSSIGASTRSRFFYTRNKGEVERDIERVGFRSLTILRPNLIGGRRDESRTSEGLALRVIAMLTPIPPYKLRINPAATIAAAIVDAVLTAPPGCHFRYSQSLVEHI